MPRPAFVGVPTSATGVNANGTGGSVTIAVPADAQAGEVLLAVLTGQGQTASDWTPPPGWTRIGPDHTDSLDHRLQSFFILPLTGSPAATYQFTAPGSGNRLLGVMVRVQNLNIDDPVVVSFGPEGTGISGTDISTSPISSTAEDGLLVFSMMANFPSPADNVTLASGPDGMTQQFYDYSGASNGAKTVVGVFTEDVDIEVIPAKTASLSVAAPQRAVRAFVLRGGQPAAPSTKTIKIYDGADLQNAAAWWYNGSDLQPVEDILALPQGERFTIADMLEENPFYWAHRGGSANFLEFTMRAYTNAVWHGAKCLEVSLQRTSDGVWVMHHDPTTTRMTGVNHTIASTPWATLQGLTQSGNGYSGPIERFDDFLASDYARTHVIIVEDKTYNHMAALLDLIESRFPRAEAVQRFIIKSYGGGGTSHAAEPAMRGYMQWGYFYDTDNPGSTPAKVALYDILGLNHDADQAHWDVLLATGKRVVGHIINNNTQAANALSKGATGLQVGNVLGVLPRINQLPGL